HRRGNVRFRQGSGDVDLAIGSGRHPARTRTPGAVMNARALVGSALVAASLLGGCALETAPAGRTSDSTRPAPAPTQKAPSASQASVDPAQVERLKRVMIPLNQVMNKPKSPSQVKVGIIDD